MLKILTWYWTQSPNKHNYDAEKVNIWAAMVRRHVTIPHAIACVTDQPEGIDPSIEIIPMPKDFESVKCAGWSESKGAPQCYRRLTMFAPDAAERFGAGRFVCMDLDVVICGNIDDILSVKEDIRFYRGTSASRPYNGSMQLITANSRPRVYTEFSQDGAIASRKKFIGSDQAWISYCLGWGEKTWDERDGVYFYTLGFTRQFIRGEVMNPPKNIRMLFFPGAPKPWEMLEYAWIRDNWHAGTPYPKPIERSQYYQHHNRQSKKGKKPPPRSAPIETPISGVRKSGLYAPRTIQPAQSFQPVRQTSVARQPPSRPLPKPHLTPPPPKAKKNIDKPELYSFRGPRGWGEQFWAAAKSLGYHCRLFTEASSVPSGARAWVRLDQNGEWRKTTRRVITALTQRGVMTLPTLRESHWYDNKNTQHKALSPWMPETKIFLGLNEALSFCQSAQYPMVSKSAAGASSATVRLLKTKAEAEAEARSAFGAGFEIKHGAQQGYVYWQRFVPGQSSDYRIVITGDLVFGLVRSCRDGDWRASGSGKFQIITMQHERERAAARLAIEISDKIKTRWMCYDFVFDGARPVVIEMSSSWMAGSYDKCLMFDRNLKLCDGKPMKEAVRILMDMDV